MEKTPKKPFLHGPSRTTSPRRFPSRPNARPITRSGEQRVDGPINPRSSITARRSFVPRLRTEENQAIKKDKIKICFLGGLAGVGERNMVFIEHREQIIVLDAGFMFPDDSMPGIDYIIPNVDYLEKNKNKIVGLFITHGHEDHIGAIPHIMDRIGNPIIYTAPLTKGIILKRQSDFPNGPKLKIQEIDTDKLEEINVGHFKVNPFLVSHTIPDALGFAIGTVYGNIFYAPDFKFDFTPVVDKASDLGHISDLSKNSLLFMGDSTGADQPGYMISERVIFEDLGKIFEKAQGRIIAATFSSLLNRIQQLIWLSEKYGRRVVVDGYSMKAKVAISRELGYLKVEKNTIISAQEAHALPNSQITIICTGAQGEDNAVLMRIVNHEHKFFKVEKGDTIIFSSSVVPGNERSVENIKDQFCRQGALVFHWKMMDIHSSGHGHQEDCKLMLGLIRPKFFVPAHGNYSRRLAHANLAKQMGIPEKNILVTDNGKMIEVSDSEIKLSGEEVPSNYVMVDGLGVGDVGDVVLRDRKQLAQDGTIVIVAMIDGETGQIKGEPEISAKGFVYAKGSKEREFKNKISEVVKDIISHSASKDRTTNWAYVKDNLRDKVGEFIFKKTERRPIVLPFVVEI